MRKDDVRRVFDGSIFYQKAEEHAAARDKGARLTVPSSITSIRCSS